VNAALVLLCVSFFTKDAVADPSEMLRVIANAYAANRESVDRGRATFFILTGRASSPDAASHGEIDDLVKGRGAYTFDGPKKKYEIIYKNDDLSKHWKMLDENLVTNECKSIYVLSDEKATMYHSPMYWPPKDAIFRNGLITEGLDLFNVHFVFPLRLGARDHRTNDVALDIDDARNRRNGLTVKLEENVPFEGTTVHKVTIEYAEGDWSYWIDDRRGCVPLQILERLRKSGNLRCIRYEQVQKVGGRLWLPYRYTFYRFHDKYVRILEIEDIQVDGALSDRDFEVSFPEPVSIIDRVHSRGYAKLTSFSLRQLSEPDRGSSKPIRIVHSAPPPQATQLPGELDSSRPWIAAVCFGISLLLVAVASYRLYRRRREADA